MDRWKGIYSETNLCVQRNQRVQLALGFPAEVVFSPSRPSLKAWVQFHASQHVLSSFCVPAVDPDRKANRQTKSCPHGAQSFQCGEEKHQRSDCSPSAGVSASSGSRVGRGQRGMAQVGMQEGLAPLRWPEKCPLTFEQRFSGSGDHLGTFTGWMLRVEGKPAQRGWSELDVFCDGGRPGDHEGQSRGRVRAGRHRGRSGSHSEDSDSVLDVLQSHRSVGSRMTM